MLNASGNECSKAVASKIPTDKLTILFTIFESTANEQLAATRALAVPASAVTRRMVCKTDILIKLLRFS
ncbi:hypothetical protein PKF023_15590 [Polynucleobacter yangtzensis]|uniref:Uncharacterized protein n=1 Tax=Polynucleobacter yangtzensis TaxID=1743159 RepID=A0A9C7FBZ2_9BURK|nr:hypothetical protein PKF023_15590 [Polynucleobacter yangtzensis]BDT79632.1 hypothetical protein PKF032_15200 [Polynucleobacter yangtzensis]